MVLRKKVDNRGGNFLALRRPMARGPARRSSSNGPAGTHDRTERHNWRPTPRFYSRRVTCDIPRGREPVTWDAVSVLLVCTGLAQCHPVTTTVALVPHFEKPLGQHILRWLEPMIDKVFRPAGLSLAWYENRRDAPANTARTLDVWFHGNCWPTPANGLLRLALRLSPHGLGPLARWAHCRRC